MGGQSKLWIAKALENGTTVHTGRLTDAQFHSIRRRSITCAPRPRYRPLAPASPWAVGGRPVYLTRFPARGKRWNT